VFRKVALMSAPYAGPPSIAAGEVTDPRSSPSRGAIFDELEKLERPRKHYQRYYQSREANEDMWRAPEGLHLGAIDAVAVRVEGLELHHVAGLRVGALHFRDLKDLRRPTPAHVRHHLVFVGGVIE
jgi:hypothetical protein